MTEMVFGTVAAKPGEPLLPRWWRTIDRWALAAVIGLFLIGLLLGFAASPPLATRNGAGAFLLCPADRRSSAGWRWRRW